MAVCDPKLLLNDRWNKVMSTTYVVFLVSQLFVFFNVLFIDLWKFVFVVAGTKFVEVDDTMQQNETYLNVLTRIIQGLVGCLSLLICVALCKVRQEKLKKAREANGVLKQLNKLKKVTWQDNQKSANKAESLECPVCLDEFVNDHEIVVLKCHKNHVFHRECLTKFLNNVSNNIGNPKCPLCQQAIEFN